MPPLQAEAWPIASIRQSSFPVYFEAVRNAVISLNHFDEDGRWSNITDNVITTNNGIATNGIVLIANKQAKAKNVAIALHQPRAAFLPL